MSEIVGVHPYAEKFPMLTDVELDELAESIASIGLINPIVVDPAGLILDGRNRLEACKRAGVEAATAVYEGSDVAEFVIGCNVTRRNMSTGARAMATALVLEAAGRRENGRWAYGHIMGEKNESVLSKSFAVRLKECGVVLDYKPDLATAVVAGRGDAARAPGVRGARITGSTSGRLGGDRGEQIGAEVVVEVGAGRAEPEPGPGAECQGDGGERDDAHSAITSTVWQSVAGAGPTQTPGATGSGINN